MPKIILTGVGGRNLHVVTDGSDSSITPTMNGGHMVSVTYNQGETKETYRQYVPPSGMVVERTFANTDRMYEFVEEYRKKWGE